MIGSSIAGALPRPQELISKTRSYDRGKLTEEELDTAFKTATAIMVKTQLDAGITLINDGMLRRQDLLRPFSTHLKNVEVGPMLRWFNNNTFYKAPLVKGEIEWKDPATFGEMYMDLLPKSSELKVVLPAPYTFAVLAHDGYYKNKVKLMNAFSESLNQEIKELEKKGFKHIQLSDPAIVYSTTKVKQSDLKTIAKALEIVTDGIKAKTILQTFFGDAEPILNDTQNWAIDSVGVDLYDTNLSALKRFKVKALILGVIDARNSIIEDPIDLTKIVSTIIKTLETDDIYVSTNCDMDFLTWDKASEKINVIKKVVTELRRNQ